MPLQIFSRKPQAGRNAPRTQRPRVPAADSFEPSDPIPLESDPLSQCLQLERYGHILANSEKWQGDPRIEEMCRAASDRIDELFAIVPEGFASLPQTIGDLPGSPEVTVNTEPFLLSRFAVTNGQYQRFVDAGGYEQLDLWPDDVWPHLIDLKDQSGRSGPRFWRGGRHSRRLAEHPVVGICFYEAEAYARWAGFRLPTEAEWQMAATWRIRSAANVLRRYPWGDALDTQRCNVWSSGIGTTVPVSGYLNGASPNQVIQLIGNVWEWTACDFEAVDDEGCNVVGDMRMSAIRGGAFDTYFTSQATSVFRTGVVCLARANNIGFRCALNLGGGETVN